MCNNTARANGLPSQSQFERWAIHAWHEEGDCNAGGALDFFCSIGGRRAGLGEPRTLCKPEGSPLTFCYWICNSSGDGKHEGRGFKLLWACRLPVCRTGPRDSTRLRSGAALLRTCGECRRERLLDFGDAARHGGPVFSASSRAGA